MKVDFTGYQKRIFSKIIQVSQQATLSDKLKLINLEKQRNIKQAASRKKRIILLWDSWNRLSYHLCKVYCRTHSETCVDMCLRYNIKFDVCRLYPLIHSPQGINSHDISHHTTTSLKTARGHINLVLPQLNKLHFLLESQTLGLLFSTLTPIYFWSARYLPAPFPFIG